jgi:hypothetical protein
MTTETTAIPLYWRTRYGSIVERQTGPDTEGFMTVRRLSDDAIRDWSVSDLRPMTDAEAVAEMTAAINAVQS